MDEAYPTPTAEDLATQRAVEGINSLAEFVDRHRRLFVLGGAGCSTDSGIPDYRDEAGSWKRRPPVTWQAFRDDPIVRARYWARSLVGWRVLVGAQPNPAHRRLAQLEDLGRIELLVTQNVDGLHEAAGSRNVIDLHGRIDRIACTRCGTRSLRATFQDRLEGFNLEWAKLAATAAPDGDSDLEATDFSTFVIPDCPVCGGMLKPDVVFFGENVPAERVERAFAALDRADALLIVGSSLMVYSGYRFALKASQLGLPIAAVNRGVTRADLLLTLKIEGPAGAVLSELCARIK